MKEETKGTVWPRRGHESLEALDGRGWLTPHPDRFNHRKEKWHPFYTRLGPVWAVADIPCNIVLLEKFIFPQLVKETNAFY